MDPVPVADADPGGVVGVEAYGAVDEAVPLEDGSQALAGALNVVVGALEDAADVEVDQDGVALGGEEVHEGHQGVDIDRARTLVAAGGRDSAERPPVVRLHAGAGHVDGALARVEAAAQVVEVGMSSTRIALMCE